MSNEENLLTAKALARRLNTSPRTIYRMAQELGLPHYSVGARGIRFAWSEVVEALRREEVAEHQ